jgi:hypothetical protein
LYSSLDIVRRIKSRRMRWAGHVASVGEGRNLYRVLMEKLEGKRSLGRPRHRLENGIEWSFGRLVLGVWSGFTQLRIGIDCGLL